MFWEVKLKILVNNLCYKHIVGTEKNSLLQGLDLKTFSRSQKTLECFDKRSRLPLERQI